MRFARRSNHTKHLNALYGTARLTKKTWVMVIGIPCRKIDTYKQLSAKTGGSGGQPELHRTDSGFTTIR